MDETKAIIAIVVFAAVAALLEFVLNRKSKTRSVFDVRRYVLFALFPIMGSVILIANMGLKYVWVFVASMLVGIAAEWLLGFYYQRIMGYKLWKYKTYSLSGYTSWLIAPAWGFAGLLFALLARIIEKF